MKNIMYDSIRATHHKMNENKIPGCFEIFGYDLMIDSNLKMWLIEVNTNSCLALNSSWQAQIIPKMLQQTFEKTVGRFYPKPEARRNVNYSREKTREVNNRFKGEFELLYSAKDDDGKSMPRVGTRPLPEMRSSPCDGCAAQRKNSVVCITSASN